MLVYHLALLSAWEDDQVAVAYRISTLGLDLDDVGFIHCAQAGQVDGVYERYYGAVTEPIMRLSIETDLLTAPWQLDDVPGQPAPFPHVYGPVNLDAVVAVEPFRASASS